MIINPRTSQSDLLIKLLGSHLTLLEQGDDHADSMRIAQELLDRLVQDAKSKPEDLPAWVTLGKSITQLIQELGSFEDQTLEVRLTFDGGETHRPISILTRRDGYCMLENCDG